VQPSFAQQAPAEPAFEVVAEEQGADWPGAAPDDDDMMLAPPPPVESLAHVPHTDGRKAIQLQTSLEYKQTLIPIFLTLALCAAATGSLHFVWKDSYFADMPTYFSYIMFAFAVPMLGFGAFMMALVHNELSKAAAANDDASA
jgi:hypothetical protein